MEHFRHLIGIVLISCLSLHAICKNPELSVSSKPVSCYGKSDGSITIDLSDTSIDKFEIILFDSLTRQIAVINKPGQLPFIQPELPAGAYNIQFSANNTMADYSIIIKSPEQLKANKINIEKLSGYPGEVEASIKANPSGGTPPYVIAWSENTDNQKGIIAKDLPQGVYRCTINDKNNCGPVSATLFLFETEIEKFIRNGEN